MKNHLAELQKVFEIQKQIQDIHPFLDRLFPIAVVENDRFLVYDVEPHGEAYRFVKETAVPMPMPRGVRAAFYLADYDNRMACVVTGDVFATLDGYVTIFHEFIHCQQAESGEPQLKQTLRVARKAQAVNDYMWEINHPFPYSAPGFVQLYQSLLNTHHLPEIETIHRQLKTLLPPDDYEYLAWQEWKEGFARFIENQIQRRLGLPENQGGKTPPFHRVAFYAGGARYIEALGKQEPELMLDVEALLMRLLQGGSD